MNNINDNCCCYSQKVIPLAFDESMSYLEKLCRMKTAINELYNLFNTELDEQIQNYIDERFNTIMMNAMYDSENEKLVLYLEDGE